MAVLQTPDGRLLRRSRPTGLTALGLSRPASSDWTDRTEDEDAGRILSYAQVYAEQPVVAAAVNKLARQIATLPLKVYRRDGANRRARVTDHPVAELLAHPLARRGAVHTKWWLIFDTLLHGNALVAKIRESPEAPPYALMPLDWSKVSAYAPEGMPVEWWSTFQFGSEERFVKAEQMIHMAWGGPGSEIGISPLHQLGVTIRNEDAARRQQTAWFRNGVRPSLVISPGFTPTGGYPSEDQLRATQKRIQETQGGPDNAAKAFVVAPGSTVHQVSMNSVEAQLLESRQLNKEDIATCYDLPVPLLGDLRHATLANVKEFGRQFYTDIIRPWLTLVEETLQAHLIDSEPTWAGENLYVEFDLSEQLKGEPRELAETIKIQIESGLMTPNEGRALLNLPPDGDPEDEDNPANRLYLPVNNLQPIGSETAAEPQQVKPPEEAPPIAAPASQE